MQNYLTLTQLRARLGNRCKSAIYYDLAAGRLPKPIKLGGKLYFLESDLDAHLRAMSEKANDQRPMTKTKDLICRSFRQYFPQFVARAEELGVTITVSKSPRKGPARVFWLDDYAQLTGFGMHTDGRPFTMCDAVQNIDKVLTEIEEDRAAAAKMSVPVRFLRVILELRKVKPHSRMIGTVHQPNGDKGHVFFFANLEGAVNLKDIGEVARAKADWRKAESLVAQHARFCDRLVADFARRWPLVKEHNPESIYH